MADIARQDVFVTSRELLCAIQRAVRAFADSIGVRVENKGAFKNRFDQITEGMMHNPITKGRGRNQTTLGLVNVKTRIGPRMIGFGCEFVTEREQILFEMIFKRGDIRMPALALARFMIGELEVVP